MNTRRRTYAFIAIVLFVVETFIALFVKDGFVRPYVGDVLAVMLVYASLRAVLTIGRGQAIAASLVVAFAVEFAQLLGVLEILNLENNTVARTLLGSSFEWLDLAAYAAGAAITLAVEALRFGYLSKRQ